jgi:hypothetical protein
LPGCSKSLILSSTNSWSVYFETCNSALSCWKIGPRMSRLSRSWGLYRLTSRIYRTTKGFTTSYLYRI